MENDVDAFFLRCKQGFTVHFGNWSKLTEIQIREIFSQYGTIQSVYRTKDETGFWFVRYCTLKEVTECIKGLKNHKFIKLLPEKSKLQNNNDNHTKKEKNKNVEKRCRIEAWIHKQGTLTDKVGNQVRNRASRSTSVDSTSKKNTSEKITSRKSYDNESFQTSSEIIEDNRPNDEFLKGNGESHLLGNVEEENKIPGLIDVDTSTNDGSVVTGIETDSISNSELKNKIICAQHIIVANLHKDVSVHYILHLFNKYDPIAVSTMQITQRTLIRYCHVYFKTHEQAIEVKTKFDRFVLSGNSLIVLHITYT